MVALPGAVSAKLDATELRNDDVMVWPEIHVGERPYAVAATPQATWVAVLGQPVMMHTPAPKSATDTLRWLLPLCR